MNNIFHLSSLIPRSHYPDLLPNTVKFLPVVYKILFILVYNLIKMLLDPQILFQPE